MTKQQLIEHIAQAKGISKRMAGLIVDIIFQGIADALARGDKIEIRGFGSFNVRHHDGRAGRNPRTGETVEVKPKKLPFFRVGKDLRERINSS